VRLYLAFFSVVVRKCLGTFRLLLFFFVVASLVCNLTLFYLWETFMYVSKHDSGHRNKSILGKSVAIGIFRA